MINYVDNVITLLKSYCELQKMPILQGLRRFCIHHRHP